MGVEEAVFGDFGDVEVAEFGLAIFVEENIGTLNK